LVFGSYPNSLDNKSRCLIPAKFRRDFEDKCMLVKGFSDCLYLFSMEAYEDYVARHVNSRPQEDDRAYDMQLYFFRNSRETDIDSQWRINIPREFVEFAGIKKEMVNISFGDRIEIWSKERLNELEASEGFKPRQNFRSMLEYEPKP